ncbi:MAG TPA: hypothetical protein VGV38_19980 [Pyrinomonadaceae bacterium]|nr:hypothetical protein [Pyrinomonadaceae bacterium]
MKSKHPHVRALLLALTLVAQLIIFAPAAAAGQNNTVENRGNVGIPGSACRNRCQRNYRLCLRRGNSRAYCRRQLNRCLRRCPQ